MYVYYSYRFNIKNILYVNIYKNNKNKKDQKNKICWWWNNCWKLKKTKGYRDHNLLKKINNSTNKYHFIKFKSINIRHIFFKKKIINILLHNNKFLILILIRFDTLYAFKFIIFTN